MVNQKKRKPLEKKRKKKMRRKRSLTMMKKYQRANNQYKRVQSNLKTQGQRKPLLGSKTSPKVRNLQCS